MTRAAWAWAAAASYLLVVGGGCSHPSPYGPRQGYPAYPAQPGAYPVAPGGSYVVPGGSVPGSMGAPSTYPSYQGSPGPTLAPPINGGGGNAPPYTFEQPPSSPGTVPNYEDPNASDFGTSPGGSGVPDDGFQSPAGNGADGSPFYPSSSAVPRTLGVEQASRPPAGTRPDYLAGLDEYDTSSRKINPAGFDAPANEDFGFDPVTSPARPGLEGPTPQNDDGFDYERSNYRWLRGVVDFDPVRKNWHIIYGLAPDPSDKYSGSLTLIDNGQMKELQDDDVVLVEGRLDPQSGRDVLGKPVYRVSRVELLGRFE